VNSLFLRVVTCVLKYILVSECGMPMEMTYGFNGCQLEVEVRVEKYRKTWHGRLSAC